jgi:hypothetical protein
MEQETNKKEKKKIQCLACGNVVAEVNGQGISFVSHKNGKITYPKVTLRYDTGGQFNLTCGCGGSTFSRVIKTLSMTYVIADTGKSLDTKD